ncbi:uncharacterized protein EpC_pEp360290 (plasmid) [Erwinia pyrifoliae Ep1/96]|uniref:hypothetical protein n=1 Tax=Erwinia pyrifoliae TaxID=79967 RepID=UPI0001B71344|nr:hypothetical protein [Erwinia pyrifoliae]AUX74603.1 hypothetical protein CPI84_19450 [Erwinia pyrifoliae]CAX53431.1 uncharacterized protein EpC_pEp360290 [Erwinia pyrifoliae Ep1/96]
MLHEEKFSFLTRICDLVTSPNLGGEILCCAPKVLYLRMNVEEFSVAGGGILDKYGSVGALSQSDRVKMENSRFLMWSNFL